MPEYLILSNFPQSEMKSSFAFAFEAWKGAQRTSYRGVRLGAGGGLSPRQIYISMGKCGTLGRDSRSQRELDF